MSAATRVTCRHRQYLQEPRATPAAGAMALDCSSFFDFSGKRGASMVSLLALPHRDIRIPLPLSLPLSQDPESVRFRWRFGRRVDTGSVYCPRPITTYSILLAR